MAGHSHWSQIKRKKAVVDQKRGKVFTKCIYDITIAVQEGGGGDPAANARLRLAIDKAKGSNVPNDTIDKAIKRATGELKDKISEHYVYEGYGVNGVAVMIEVNTDNKNRTVSEIRHAFSKCGGTLGENGCVGWMFERLGSIRIQKSLAKEDKLFEEILDLGAEDLKQDDECFIVYTQPHLLHQVMSSLSKNYKIEESEILYIPKTLVAVSGEAAEKSIKLLEMLDDLDDVINVHANCEIED